MFGKDEIKVILVGSTQDSDKIGLFSGLNYTINRRLIDGISFQILDYRENEYNTPSSVAYQLSDMMDGVGFNKNNPVNAVIYFNSVDETLKQNLEKGRNCSLFINFFESTMTPEALLKSIAAGVSQKLVSSVNTTLSLIVGSSLYDTNSDFFKHFPKEITRNILQTYVCSVFKNDYLSFVFFKSAKNLNHSQLLTASDKLLNSAENLGENKNIVKSIDRSMM